jgi:hypothetical protein
MLTRLFSAAHFGARPVMGGGVALALLAAPLTVEPAFAGAETLTCVGSRGSVSCVRQWGPSVDPHIRHAPGPRDPREEAEVAERERRWVARCRPIILQDQYGVARYRYAAPGCEYGVIQD